MSLSENHPVSWISPKPKYSISLPIIASLNGVREWKNQETALQVDLGKFRFLLQQKVSNPDLHRTALVSKISYAGISLLFICIH